jgi:hypothetical protein
MTDQRINPEAVKALEAREAIVRKGMRLQIATELLAGMYAGSTEHVAKNAALARGAALEQADSLIRENEAMP